MRVLSVENTKMVEELANESGISYLQLMENAGSYCARIIRKTFETVNKRNVLIVCGKGKNGGDGFVIARKLRESNYNVTVMMTMGLPSDEISSEMLSRVRALGITVVYYDTNAVTDKYFENAQVIVDCIFGIGFRGIADDFTSSVFKKINASSATVVSIDIPSGLNGDSGEVTSECVNADMTIAVMALKPVHVLKPSVKYCGKVVVAPIGVPDKCFEKIESSLFTATSEEIKAFFKKREENSHKGTYGTVLIIGGSYEMPNAVYLASQAAVNSGAGLVKTAFPSFAYNAIASKTVEQVLIPLESNKNGRISQYSLTRIGKELKKCSCAVIGCGMGVDSDTKAITEYVIKNAEVPVIIDADGINCLKDNIDILDGAKTDIVLTPHPKEFSRITGVSVAEIEENRENAVRNFIKSHKCILVLKGASTLVGSAGYSEVYVNSTGNPGMATGGCGDVLAGIIASFIAQGTESFKSAVSAVNIHGAAGDCVSEKYSVRGNTPSLILAELPSVLKRYE